MRGDSHTHQSPPSPILSLKGREVALISNNFNNRIKLLVNHLIRKSDDVKSLFLQPPCPSLVIFFLLKMATSIHLNDQFLVYTTKISNIISRRKLSSKFIPIQLTIS